MIQCPLSFGESIKSMDQNILIVKVLLQKRVKHFSRKDSTFLVHVQQVFGPQRLLAHAKDTTIEGSIIFVLLTLKESLLELDWFGCSEYGPSRVWVLDVLGIPTPPKKNYILKIHFAHIDCKRPIVVGLLAGIFLHFGVTGSMPPSTRYKNIFFI